MNSFEKHTKIVLLLTNLFIAIVVLVAIESVLKLWAPLYYADAGVSYEYDEVLGYKYRSGIHLLESTDYQKEDYVNKIGTVNFQSDFEEYDKLIFTIGDSYTKGTGLPADANYPFQLDLILNVDSTGIYQKEYGIVNLGTTGYGIEQSLLALQIFAKRIGKPDYVLFLGAENDYEDDQLFKNGYRHKHMVRNNPFWNKWYMRPLYFVLKTELGRRLKLFVSTIRINRIMAPSDELNDNSVPIAQLSESGYKKIIAAVRKYDAIPIITWIQSPSDSYSWLKEWSLNNHVSFADWLPSVLSIQNSIPAIPIINPNSGGHRRTWVLQMVAKAYAKEIQKQER